MLFFDVGCNAGSFVKAVEANVGKCNVYCFEPHPVLAQKTKATYPYITMNESIVHATDMDKYTIFIPELSCGISSVVKRPVFTTLGQPIIEYDAPAVTLDTYCKSNGLDHIDFLKIDVERAELNVFKGCVDMLQDHRIKAGVFEIGDTQERRRRRCVHL